MAHMVPKKEHMPVYVGHVACSSNVMTLARAATLASFTSKLRTELRLGGTYR